jgi:hypothetical protein
VPKAIERVLADAGRPVRAREIHTEVEELLGRSVPISSVKNWLAKSALAEASSLVRLGLGRYMLLMLPSESGGARGTHGMPCQSRTSRPATETRELEDGCFWRRGDGRSVGSLSFLRGHLHAIPRACW